MKTIERKIIHIISHKVSPYSLTGNKYLVARTEDNDIVMGEMRNPVAMRLYRLYGDWKESTNPKFPGKQFKFISYEPVIQKTTEGYIDFLQNIPGVGPIIAAKIVGYFGNQVIDVLSRNPNEIYKCDIRDQIALSIEEYFINDDSIRNAKARAALAELFQDIRMPQRVFESLLDGFGADAAEFIKSKPYELLNYSGIGWKTADTFAVKKCQYNPKGIDRQKAAIIEAMEQLAAQGNTIATQVDIKMVVFKFLGCSPDASAWEQLIKENKIVIVEQSAKNPVFALERYDRYEKEVAERLVDLSSVFTEINVGSDGLENEQIKAIEIIKNNQVSILTGIPGSGKSYTITKVISELSKQGFTMMLVCPTGKAAKRAAELLQHHLPGVMVPCSTIHRALGVQGMAGEEGIAHDDARVNRGRDEFGFAHNEECPLDVDIIFIDESSMQDIEISCALLRALREGTRVVYIGDHYQLPSVGPGSVLRDMIDGGIPTATLKTPRRHAGRIVHACAAIKDGKTPHPSEVFNWQIGENWQHIECETQEEILEEIVQIYTSCLAQSRREVNHPFWSINDVFWDVQTISPQNEDIPISCDKINLRLSHLLNRNAQPNPVDYVDNKFRVGDKVIRTKNGRCIELVDFEDAPSSNVIQFNGQTYEKTESYIVNGDMGQVVGWLEQKGKWYVVVKFVLPDRLCMLPANDCRLLLAYAITVHKSQGSGFPYLIVPVHKGIYWDASNNQGLWNRELIYTSLSRAEVILRTVGQFDAIKLAISRKTMNVRKTNLANHIRRLKNVNV